MNKPGRVGIDLPEPALGFGHNALSEANSLVIGWGKFLPQVQLLLMTRPLVTCLWVEWREQALTRKILMQKQMVSTHSPCLRTGVCQPGESQFAVATLAFHGTLQPGQRGQETGEQEKLDRQVGLPECPFQ